MNRIDRIAQLWNKGQSLSAIGFSLGVSRGAVAGMIRRARAAGDRRFTERPPTPNFQPSRPRILIDLNWNDCRWSVDHTEDDVHLFCGQPQIPGSPYCAKHEKMAHP